MAASSLQIEATPRIQACSDREVGQIRAIRAEADAEWEVEVEEIEATRAEGVQDGEIQRTEAVRLEAALDQEGPVMEEEVGPQQR